MNSTLKYDLAQADLEAFFTYHARHAPYILRRNRRMRWIWGGLFALLAFAYGSWSLAGTIMFVMIAVIFLLFYARVNRWWYIRHNLRINSGPDGPRFGATKLELAGGQLLVEAPEGSSKLDLSAIRRIDECDTHFFIYTGPVSAIIVPKLGSQAEVFIRSVRSAKGPTYT